MGGHRGQKGEGDKKRRDVCMGMNSSSRETERSRKERVSAPSMSYERGLLSLSWAHSLDGLI